MDNLEGHDHGEAGDHGGYQDTNSKTQINYIF